MSNDTVRLVPAHEREADERRASALIVLEEAADEIRQGLWDGVMVVLEGQNVIDTRWSPTADKRMRVGGLEMLKHEFLSDDEE